MIDVFGPMKSMIKIENVCIDNWVFRFHYKFTVLLLTCFTLMVTSRQYFGDPIDCIVDGSVKLIIDNYCWVESTYTVPSKNPNHEAHPGVSSHHGPVKHHKYYQWIPIVLAIQAGLFYLPRYFWKVFEGNRARDLVMDLNYPVVDNDIKNDRKKIIIDYITTNLHKQNMYFIQYVICEIINFVNVAAQIYLMDIFLDGEFKKNGFKMLDLINMIQYDDKTIVFPIVTKCMFKMYGPSGSFNTLDALCVLPLNVINRKIFVVMWVVFWLLAICSGIGLLYRFLIMVIPKCRLMLLKSACPLSIHDEVNVIFKKFQIGDWFMMYQLAGNMNPFVLKEIVIELAEQVNEIPKENV